MATTEQAIEELYRARYVGLRNALTTVAGSREAARDALQEAFATALASREQFRGDGDLAAWIWRIAYRAVLRRHASARPPLTLEHAPEPVVELPDPLRDPVLTAALRRLPPRRRLVVFLRFFADCSYREIAEMLDVSEGTVAATLAQATDALRAELEDEEPRQRERRTA